MGKSFRVMFDTNVYERLFKYDLGRIQKLIENGKVIVYGCRVIRDELRSIPTFARYEGKSYRRLLLSTYDGLVGKHSFPVEELAEKLAKEYWKEYKGGVSKRKIFPDFLIVATATLHTLDIIVSGDEKTMKSRAAKVAYHKANNRNALNTPNFIRLEELA